MDGRTRDSIPDEELESAYPTSWAYLHRTADQWNRVRFDTIERHQAAILLNASYPEAMKASLQLALA